MSDTPTITQDERARLRGILSEHGTGQVEDRIILRLLDALEQAEAQLAAALQVNATRQAEVTADVLNAMMAGITGQKESVRVEVDGFQCPYCNETSKTIEDATAHDAICPKHPAVIRAEQAEAEVARLTKERDWLAEKHIRCAANGEQWYGPTVGKEMHVPMYPSKAEAVDALKEAARRAVAESEVEII